MTAATGRARARVGLLGNPGDLYRGKVLAATIDAFETVATVRATAEAAPTTVQADVADLQRLLVNRVCPGQQSMALGVDSDVPLRSGLSGSSAILLATLRALDAHLGLGLDPLTMAQIVWDVERHDLGIIAGPQDRVVQALGGLQFMDFSGPTEIGVHEALDPALLPPMVVAWPKRAGQPSGDAHQAVWSRWRKGDLELRRRIRGFATLADEGRNALLAADVDGFADAIDANFDLRREIFSLDNDACALVEKAREAGSAAKYCGSGGAIIAVPRPGTSLDVLADELERTASVCRRVRVALSP